MTHTGGVAFKSRQIGRYMVFRGIGAGGMASVHLARFFGSGGFSRIVAVKHLHSFLSADPDLRRMLIAEALLASRVRHPNVVPVLDILEDGTDLFLVMEYVHGESLSALRRAARTRASPIPPAIVSAIMIGVLQGLHAAHEARTESGRPLEIVHRDVSPTNIVVTADGVPMVIDFGVAKAMQAREDTGPGVVKGKGAYMAPEQIRGEPVSRATDVFAASVVLWELLTGQRLFDGATEMARMRRVLEDKPIAPPSSLALRLPAGLDYVAARGLRANPQDRYVTAMQMAEALERVIAPAPQRVVGEWVTRTAAEALGRRSAWLRELEVLQAPMQLPDLTTPRPEDRDPARNQRAVAPGARTNETRTLAEWLAAGRRWLGPRDHRLWVAAGAVGIVLAGVGAGSAMSRRPAAAPAVSPRERVSTLLMLKPILIIPQPARTPDPVAAGIERAPATPVPTTSKARNDLRRGGPGSRSVWRRRWSAHAKLTAPPSDLAAGTTVRGPPAGDNDRTPAAPAVSPPPPPSEPAPRPRVRLLD